MYYYKINLNNIIKLDTKEFYNLCKANPHLRLQKTARGELIIMSPIVSEIGRQNAKLIHYFCLWNDQKQLGEVFDSNAGFTFPDTAIFSPDLSWIEKSRWEQLNDPLKLEFAPIVPDFVLEHNFDLDNKAEFQAKMLEYISAGVRLAWLIISQNKTVEIYRPGVEKQILQNPTTLSGEDVLPEFELNLAKIWD